MSKEQICLDFNRDLQKWKDQAVTPTGKGDEYLHREEFDQLSEIYKKHQLPICPLSSDLKNGEDVYYSISNEYGEAHFLNHFHLYNQARYKNFLLLSPISLSQSYINEMSVNFNPNHNGRSSEDKGGLYILKTEKMEITIKVKEGYSKNLPHSIIVITEQEYRQKKLDEQSLQDVLKKAGLQNIASKATISQYQSSETPDPWMIDEWNKAFNFWGSRNGEYIPEKIFKMEKLPYLERRQKLRIAIGELITKLLHLYKARSLQGADREFKELQQITSSVLRSFSSSEIQRELTRTETKLPETIQEACEQIINRFTESSSTSDPVELGLLEIAQKAGKENETKLIEFTLNKLIETASSSIFSHQEMMNLYKTLKEWRKEPKGGSALHQKLIKALTKKREDIRSTLEKNREVMEDWAKLNLTNAIAALDQFIKEIQ